MATPSAPDGALWSDRFHQPIKRGWTDSISSRGTATWEKTRHAIAFQRLPEADRTDTCVTCHTAPRLDGALVPNVHCQDCHQGADAHAMAAEPKLKRTTGRHVCRSCHDTFHHPAFQFERGWALIKHGVRVQEGAK